MKTKTLLLALLLSLFAPALVHAAPDASPIAHIANGALANADAGPPVVVTPSPKTQSAPSPAGSAPASTFTVLGAIAMLVAGLKLVQSKEKGLAAVKVGKLDLSFLALPAVDDAIAFSIAALSWWLTAPAGGTWYSKVLVFAGYAAAAYMATFVHTSTQKPAQ